MSTAIPNCAFHSSMFKSGLILLQFQEKEGKLRHYYLKGNVLINSWVLVPWPSTSNKY